MYKMHRVFCALPAEMQEERRAFYQTVGEFNAEQGLSRGILFVPVAASSALRGIAPVEVRENIRACRHYIEVVPAGAGAPEDNPQHDYAFAAECCADPSLPMKEVVVLRRAAGADLHDFSLRVREFLLKWLAALGRESAGV
jgi:hypothetical protein